MRECERSKTVLGNSRGASMVLMAITMVALLSATALAIDIGMLLNARTEAQRAADAAALAGAGSLIVCPDPVCAGGAATTAENKAIEYGALNTVTDIPVTLLPEDVDVDLAQERVTVTVRRIGARGTAVGTWFANVFGVAEVDVEARAAAEAQPSGAARCVKPFSIYDYFNDVNTNDEWDEGIDEYDPLVHGYGSDWRNPGHPGDDGLGYINDFGRPITIKGNQKNGDPCCPGTGPSWYYPWDIPQISGGPASGAARYRWNIANCNPSTVYVGEPYDKENGNMWGPTVQGVEDLYDKDPGAYWDDVQNRVMGSAWEPNWEASPRIGIVPTFDPTIAFKPGKKEYEFTNFMAVFIEGVTGNGNNQQVHGRILYATGVAGGSDPGSTVKFIRLVE